MAARGREPGLRLERGEQAVTLVEWGAEILADLAPIAARLDGLDGGRAYRDAVADATARLQSPDQTPSARVLASITRDFDNSYVAFTRAQSIATRAALLALPFSDAAQARGVAETQASVQAQKDIEANDSMPFEIYRQQYLMTERLGVPGKRTPAVA